MLDDDERDAVLATVKSATTLPIMMGAAATTTKDVLRRIYAAMPHAPQTFLVPAPAYLKPSQQALLAFFRTIADDSPVPLVLYDVPSRSGVRIELDTLLELAAHPRIVALKDCGGRVDQTEALIADGRLQVLCGNDEEWYSSRALGCDGAIAASAHIRTDLFVAFDTAIARGELIHARALWRMLKPLAKGMFDEPSPAPVKALLADAGECANELRQPMTPASATLTERLRRIVDALPDSA